MPDFTSLVEFFGEHVLYWKVLAAILVALSAIMVQRAFATGIKLSMNKRGYAKDPSELPALHKKKLFQVHATIVLFLSGMLITAILCWLAPSQVGSPFFGIPLVPIAWVFFWLYKNNGYRAPARHSANGIMFAGGLVPVVIVCFALWFMGPPLAQ